MIKIMVDSASDCLPNNSIADLYMPLTVKMGEREYRDGIDLDKDSFYSLLTSTKCMPQTSQPSPGDFIKIFEKIKDDGDTLIYFALSSALSGTYQCACIAKSMVEYENIHIIDTKTVTHMIAMMAEYAYRLIGKGCTAEEIVSKCESLRERIKVFAGAYTLEYLKNGGRLSNSSAVIGTLAHIKPVVTVTEDGRVEAIGKCIGVAKAVQYILDRTGEYEIDEEFGLYSLYTYGERNCGDLEEKFTAAGYNISKRLQIGSTIGAHVGPGVYGVFFVEKEK